MKTWLRFVLLANMMLGRALGGQAQIVGDKVFGLRLSAGSSQRVVNLSDNKNRVMQVLGPPTKTSRYYAETENAWATVLHYGSNRLDFTHDRLDLVELHDARLTVGRPGTAGFHVGSVLPRPSLGKTPLAFGNFKVVYKPGKSYNFTYSAHSSGYMKTAKGQVLDVAYEILYDQQGRVAHIFLDQSYD